MGLKLIHVSKTAPGQYIDSWQTNNIRGQQKRVRGQYTCHWVSYKMKTYMSYFLFVMNYADNSDAFITTFAMQWQISYESYFMLQILE